MRERVPEGLESKRVEEREKQVDAALAATIEQEAKEKLRKAQTRGDEELKKEAEVMLEMADEVRRNGEYSLLVALGVLGRRDD